MALNLHNLKLNKIIATHTTAYRYNIGFEGTELPPTMSTAGTVALSPDGLKLFWNLGNYSANHRYSHAGTEINFDAFDQDPKNGKSVSIEALAIVEGTAVQISKGGIVIRDSTFPPPRTLKERENNYEVTNDLVIHFMECERIGEQLRVSMHIKHRNPQGLFTYSFPLGEYLISNYNTPTENFNIARIRIDRAPRPDSIPAQDFTITFLAPIVPGRFNTIIIFSPTKEGGDDVLYKKGMVHLVP